MKKIIVYGLQYESNLGDQVIGCCVEYLLKKAIEEIKEEVEIIPIDMLGRESIESHKPYVTSVNSAKEVIKRILPKSVISTLNKLRNSLSDHKNAKKVRMRTRSLANATIDNDVIAIIFAGGGIIKFKAQEFYLLIDEITKYANDKKIPVMLNAVGVEGFDILSAKCRVLKKALNRECIKVITTRDDIETLNSKYLNKNRKCFTEQVADPAFWADVVYQNSILKEKKATVGLSVARAGLFEDHGIKFSTEELILFWKNLIELLEKNQITWKLFCNGTFSDYEFLNILLEEPEFKERKNDIALPRAVSGEELVNQISGFEVVLACRLHAGIISYSLGIPELLMVWNDKQIHFSKFIGCQDRYLSRESINAENAYSKIIDIRKAQYPVYVKEQQREKTYLTLRNFVKNSITGEYNGF